MATQARLFVAALLLLSATPTTEAITPNLWFDMTVPASSGLTFYTLVASTEGSSMIGQGTSFEKDAPTQAQRANWHFVTKVIGSKLYVSGGSDGATANNNALAAFASDESSDVSKQPRRTNLRTIPSGRFDGILGEYDLSFQQTETSFFPEAVTAVTVDTMTITTGMVSSLSSFDQVTKTEVPFALNGNPNPAMSYVALNGLELKSATDGGNAQWRIPDASRYGAQTSYGVNVNTSPTLVTTIKVPSNTAYFILRGSTGQYHGVGHVSASPTPDFWRMPSAPILYGFTYDRLWFETWRDHDNSNNVLTMSPLDPNIDYTLTVTTYGNITGLHSITYYSDGDLNGAEVGAGTTATTTSIVTATATSTKTATANGGQNSSGNSSSTASGSDSESTSASATSGSSKVSGSSTSVSSHSGTSGESNTAGAVPTGGDPNNFGDTSSGSESETAKGSSKKGLIAGLVVGLVVLAALVAAALFWFCRRKRTKNPISISGPIDAAENGTPFARFTLPRSPEPSHLNGTPEVVETIHSPEKFNRVLGIPASSPSVLTRGDEAASESCGATGISTSISTPSSEYSHAHALPRTPEQQIQQQMPTHAIDMGSLERVSAYQLPPMYNPQWQAGHTRSSSSSSSVLELEVKAAVVGGAYGQTVQGSSR